MSVLKRILLLILLLLVLLLAVVAYATMTHGGMKRLFSLGQSYAQGELTWGESSGKLLGPATLDDILFVSDAGASVKIQKARFDWQPRQLLSRTLQVDDLDLSGITVRLPPPSDEPEQATEPFQLRDLALPLGAEIERVSLTDIKVYPHGSEEPIVVDEIKLSAGARDADLKLVELSVSAPQGQLTMDGTVNTSGDWPLDVNQQWRVNHPQFGEFNGSGSMQGNIKSLRLQHAVKGAATVDIDTIVNDITGELSWDGSIAVNSDDLGVFSEGLAGIPVSVDALTNGALKDYQATGAVNSELPQTGPLTADFNVGGSLDELQIKQVLVNLEQSTANAKINGNVQFADLQSDITVQWADVPWPLLVGDSTDTENTAAAAEPLALSPSGKLRFNGNPDSFDINLDSLLQQDTTGELQLTAQLDGSPQLINVQSVSLKSLQGSTDLDVKGVIDIQNNNVDIDGQWTELTWPLVDTEDTLDKIFQSEAGSFSVTGPLDGYQVDAEIQVAGKDIPDGQWQFDAQGNAESLSDIKLQGQTLDGVINGSGSAQWSPATKWNIDLTAEQINPAIKWPGLDGNIGLAVQSTGAVSEAGPDINIKILDVNGDYKKQALSGSGEINIVNGEIQIDRLDLKAGLASVNANGKLAETLDLDWKLNAPALEKLVPGVSGDIDISGKVAGPVDSPTSDFSVDIKNFQSDGVEVKTINGGGSIDLSGQAQSTLKLNANEITAAGQVWDKMVLDGSGSPEEHKVSLSLVGEQADLSLSASGGVQGEQWQGTLDQINIAKTAVGDWALEQPVTISASAQAVEASRLCLVSDPSSLCVDGEWDAKKGAAADIELKELHAERFSDYLPPDIEIDAALQGTARVVTDASGKPEVTADFTVPGGNINYIDTGEPVTDKLGQSRLQFELKDDNLKSKVDLDLGPIGTVNTNTIIGGLSTTKSLSGTVKTDIEDMSLVSIFAPDLQAVDGKFDTDMTLSGTLDSPQVLGETALNGLVTEVPAIAMKVLDGTMKVESDGKGGLNVKGRAISGDGHIDINGVMNPTTGDMELVIKGEQFEVANTARQRAVVSPDLRVVINGSNITVTGDVHIPSAYIEAGGENAVVTESSDVVIVNSDDDSAETKEESQVSLDVKVTLGDDIRVNAGPFDGALGGALTVQQVPGRVPTGSGAIEVISGDFLVYGQKLTMEQGRILFGGGPIDNPALEIDVAREVVAYEVKAGARIRGTAQAPLLQLQSDPTQTDANTLSFILFGKPVGTVGASYTLGKFITPDLYVSYGIDLFDKIQSFNLRYKISERLSLIGARSDETQGADLIYRIER